MKRNNQVIIFLAGFTIAMIIAGAVGAVGVYYAQEASRYSYARGMYDLCVTLAANYFGLPPTTAIQNCLVNVSAAMASRKFYETESPGFVWPLPSSNQNEGQQ